MYTSDLLPETELSARAESSVLLYSFLQARHFLVSINPAIRNQKRVVKEKEKTLEKF